MRVHLGEWDQGFSVGVYDGPVPWHAGQFVLAWSSRGDPRWPKFGKLRGRANEYVVEVSSPES